MYFLLWPVFRQKRHGLSRHICRHHQSAEGANGSVETTAPSSINRLLRKLPCLKYRPNIETVKTSLKLTILPGGVFPLYLIILRIFGIL